MILAPTSEGGAECGETPHRVLRPAAPSFIVRACAATMGLGEYHLLAVEHNKSTFHGGVDGQT